MEIDFLFSHKLRIIYSSTNTFLYELFILLRTHSFTNTFLYEHIPLRTHSSTNTFLYEHLLPRTHSSTNTFLYEHILPRTRSRSNKTRIFYFDMTDNLYSVVPIVPPPHFILKRNSLVFQSITCKQFRFLYRQASFCWSSQMCSKTTQHQRKRSCRWFYAMDFSMLAKKR